jgi:hypothetical protein
MGRPKAWSGPTRPIRVPESLADHLIEIARQLDNPEPANNVQNPSGLPTCKPKADAETIAQGLAEGWISHKLPDYPLRMLTSESPTGTYRLFLEPPRELPPKVEASIEEYCDRVFESMTERERIHLLTGMIEKLGEKVDV